MSGRKDIVQKHQVQQVQKAINSTIYGQQNKRIMYNIFIQNKTYEQAAFDANLSLRGLHKRVKKIYPSMERYLNKLN